MAMLQKKLEHTLGNLFWQRKLVFSNNLHRNMKNFWVVLLSLLFVKQIYALDVVVRNDNGSPQLSNYPERYFWEESKILKPDGPCILKKVQIYYVGSTPNIDTIYIAGDPSEGYLPPTLWVIHYNQKAKPIIFNYPGKPGWYEFNVENILIGGLDRIVIQHRLNQSGPWFAIDNDGISQPYSSFLMNPFETNSLGGPGNYYVSNGDYLVRLVVEYIYPSDSTSAKPPFPSFVDVTKEVGLVDGNGNYIKSSDASVIDLNNDGFDDVAIGGFVFKNDGNGQFSNISSKVNINAGMTSWGDFNNDGYIDCYALRNGNYDENLKMVFSQDRIYKNNGNETFTELKPREVFKLPYPDPGVDFRLGKPTQQDSIPNPYSCITPLWTDVNNDGRLDLFLANNRVGLTISGNYVERYFPDQLWIQDSDGKFKNVTQQCGILQYELFSSNQSALGYYDCYGANANDYNNDGQIDIFVANYRLVRDLLYRNNGNGTFSNVGDVTGVQGVPTVGIGYYGHGMGSEWGDFNNDGYPDLVVGNLGHPDWRGMYSNPSLIFKNEGPPNFTFKEQHQEMGLKFFEMNAGATWGDFDLDGYLDLWHGQISYRAEGDGGEPKRPGRIYMNSGPPDYKLIDKTWEFGCVVHGPWNAVRIDFDNDGDLDLLVASSHVGVRLFRNDLERKGNWVGFRLRGSPQDNVNMDCYGTKIIVYCGSQKFYRDLMGSISGNRCSQNSNLLHFGIGNCSKIDSVVVIYSNGFRKTYKDIEPNKYYIINYNQNLIQSRLNTPQCLQPKNYQFGLPDSVEFYWTNVGGAIKYEINVADNPNFTNSKNYQTGQNHFSSVGFERSKQYFWKVRAISSNDTSQWSSTFSFYSGNPIPSKVQLYSPVDNSSKLSLTPKFVWGKPNFPLGLDVKYTFQLQIATDEQFQNVVATKSNLKDTSFILEDKILQPGTKYYWRVRALNIDSNGVWSDPFSFSTNFLPGIVSLTSPENNSADVPLKPTFRWQPIDNVEEYVLQLSLEENFDTVVVEKTLQATIYKHLTSLQPEKIYYWRVCGKNNVGLGPWSEIWKFQTTSATLVEFLNNSGVKVFPNPFDSEIVIELESAEIVKVSLIDFLGRKVYNNEFLEKIIKVNLENIVSGPYILKIETQDNNSLFLLFKLKKD
jgi:hypothetical protein